MKLKNFLKLFFCLLILPNLLAAKAADDTEITKRLNILMATHSEFNKRIDYEVSKGVIVLQGEVTNFADKAFVERIATNIPGVYRVRNLLVIDYSRKNF